MDGIEHLAAARRVKLTSVIVEVTVEVSTLVTVLVTVLYPQSWL